MSILTNKKVIVTGGAGFVGSHLVERLLAIGAHVTVVDTLEHGMAPSAPYRSVWRLDAGDADALEPAFQGAFAVFNLAAHVAGVQYNQSNQLEMFERNLRLQVAPILAAERAGVARFLQVSSVCVYAPEHNSPAKEEHGHDGEPVGANNGYSWAKRMGERAALYSRIPQMVIVRPSNIYGPRDHFRPRERAHVIPALMDKVARDEVVVVNGSGKEVREFIYVEDVAQGMIAAMERGQHRTVYNLGTHGVTSVPIARLVKLIQRALGTQKPVEFTRAYDPGDPARWSDATNITIDTHWSARVRLSEGLAATAEWYRRELLCASSS